MAVQFSKAVEEALIAAGLVREAHAPTAPVAPSVASDATLPAAPGFIPPVWYGRLRFACTNPRARGATLFGPRGSGKTTAVHRLAEQVGIPLVTFQAAAGCTIDDLQGVRDLIDGKTVFTPGPLAQALRDDTWLLIEEANVMHPAVFSKLNTLTDGSGDTLALPDGTRLAAGPKFRVILAFNEGSSYTGTREVNAALRDRLKPIFAGYMEPNDEAKMLQQRTGCDENTALSLVLFAKDVRAGRRDHGFDLSPRALMGVLDLIRFCGETWEQAFEHGILDLIGDPDDKRITRDTIDQIAKAANLATWPVPTFAVASDATPTDGAQ
jgi:hypothetical protein